MSLPFREQLDLPPRGLSRRDTIRKQQLQPGETLVLFEQDGPGCLAHWGGTWSRNPDLDPHDRIHDMQLRIFYDGSGTPAVDMTLGQFYGILLGKDVHTFDCAALKILPANALNCYFPMPFRRMRMELVNTGPVKQGLWFMADWQAYPDLKELTPLRLHARYAGAFPAPHAGSFKMLDISGSGFLAGWFYSVRVRDTADSWYHNGGDLWLLDGESSPNALRGIGGEDVFNMSFGIFSCQSEWVGCTYLNRVIKDKKTGPGYEGMVPRIFGPDPVWFDSSAVVRFGTLANDMESVFFSYLDPESAPAVLTPIEWKLAGPFRCESWEDFQKAEWAESPISKWPANWTPGFGSFVFNDKAVVFDIPMTAPVEHAWCDLTQHLRGAGLTNVGTQPVGASAYAVGNVTIPHTGHYRIKVGFDDWMKLWVNGKEVFTGRHEKGFAATSVECDLPTGEVELRVKLSNEDNLQWRLWAFTLTLEK